MNFIVSLLAFLSLSSLAHCGEQEKKMRFFCLDIHGSVSADVKNILEELGHEVTVWFMPGPGYSQFTFGRLHDDINFDFQSWVNADTPAIFDHFFEKNRDFLNQFDGYIVALCTSLAPLYEKTNKPIIVINAVKYEFPFRHKTPIWEWLHAFLFKRVAANKLFLVANNKGDRDYLKQCTGLESEMIPSLCLYTKTQYKGNKQTFLVHPHLYMDRFFQILTRKFPQIIGNDITRPYRWEDLYSYKGIIHFPYQISTMSLFEQYSANVPLFFPSKAFLTMLRAQYPEILKDVYYYRSEFNGDKSDLPWNDLNNPFSPLAFQFWVDHADFYDPENMPYIQYFHSFNHLKSLLLQSDLKQISRKMKKFNQKRKQKVYHAWRELLKKVALACEES